MRPFGPVWLVVGCLVVSVMTASPPSPSLSPSPSPSKLPELDTLPKPEDPVDMPVPVERGWPRQGSQDIATPDSHSPAPSPSSSTPPPEPMVLTEAEINSPTAKALGLTPADNVPLTNLTEEQLMKDVDPSWPEMVIIEDPTYPDDFRYMTHEEERAREIMKAMVRRKRQQAIDDAVERTRQATEASDGRGGDGGQATPQDATTATPSHEAQDTQATQAAVPSSPKDERQGDQGQLPTDGKAREVLPSVNTPDGPSFHCPHAGGTGCLVGQDAGSNTIPMGMRQLEYGHQGESYYPQDDEGAGHGDQDAPAVLQSYQLGLNSNDADQ